MRDAQMFESGRFTTPPPNFHQANSSAPAFTTDVAQPKGKNRDRQIKAN